MEDVLDIEEVAETEHGELCFCQLCRPVLADQDEPVVVSYEAAAA